MSNLPTIEITSEMWAKYFWPIFLHMIMPFVALMIVFGIIRIIFAKLLRGQRTLRILVDGLIVLVFLLAAGFIAPIVINTAKLPPVPDFEELENSIYSSVESAVREAMENASTSSEDN